MAPGRPSGSRNALGHSAGGLRPGLQMASNQTLQEWHTGGHKKLMEKIYSISYLRIFLCIFLSMKTAFLKQNQWLQAKSKSYQIKNLEVLQRFYHHHSIVKFLPLLRSLICKWEIWIELSLWCLLMMSLLGDLHATLENVSTQLPVQPLASTAS